MATVYVASTEAFVGKSAVCAGLLDHAQRAGLRTAYMKPVSVSVAHVPGAALDEDAAFIREALELGAPLDQMAPVLLTPSAIERVLGGEQHDWGHDVREAFAAIAQGADLTVLEGTNSWSEGALIGLSADHVAAMLDAKVLLVTRYRTTLAVDAILAVRRWFGDRLAGVLINQVPVPQLDFVQERVAPFLEQQGIPVLGLLPDDTAMAGIQVSELLEHLGGQVLAGRAGGANVIEALMVGAMGAEASLSHFRRRANKAVITGGDRADLQLAALETSTSALVLTGNFRPPQQVLDRADDRKVPVILVPDDTLTTIERIEALFGHVRFHQPAKLDRFRGLLDARCDWPRLHAALGLAS
ncbi:MAG TPA: phosphotransacetylase family protein [Herpetosiphonaceae bacterium]